MRISKVLGIEKATETNAPGSRECTYLLAILCTSLLLSLPVVHQPDFQYLITLCDHHSSHIVSLPINNGESPNLLPGPALPLVNHIALDMSLPIRAAILLVPFKPALLQEVIWNLRVVDCEPAGLALQAAEEVVLV